MKHIEISFLSENYILVRHIQNIVLFNLHAMNLIFFSIFIFCRGETLLPADSIVTNRTIVELNQYLKLKSLPWSDAKQWLCRMYHKRDCHNLMPI